MIFIQTNGITKSSTWERCSGPTLRISLFLWWICFILVFEEHCRSNADKIQVRLLSLTAFQVLLNVFLCSHSEILFGVAWGGGGLNFKVEEMREERAIEYVKRDRNYHLLLCCSLPLHVSLPLSSFSSLFAKRFVRHVSTVAILHLGNKILYVTEIWWWKNI